MTEIVRYDETDSQVLHLAGEVTAFAQDQVAEENSGGNAWAWSTAAETVGTRAVALTLRTLAKMGVEVDYRAFADVLGAESETADNVITIEELDAGMSSNLERTEI